MKSWEIIFPLYYVHGRSLLEFSGMSFGMTLLREIQTTRTSSEEKKKITVCDKRLKGLFIFNLASNNPKRNILQVPTEESKLLSASPVSKTRSYKIRAFHWISGNTFKQWDFFNNGTYYLWLVVDSPSLEVFKESLDSHLLEILYALDFLHWEGRWSRWHIRLLIPWLYDHPIWPHIITGT